jgi:hypothetical protein
MEFNVPECSIQLIDHEGSFADITVDAGNSDHIFSNVNIDVSYEDTLEDMEKTMGYVHVFMRYLPKKVLIHNRSSWKMVDEINMERARYLLNTDEILEEKSGQTQT